MPRQPESLAMTVPSEKTPAATSVVQVVDDMDSPIDTTSPAQYLDASIEASALLSKPGPNGLGNTSVETTAVPDVTPPSTAKRNPFETDIEAMITQTTTKTSRPMGDHMHDSDSRVWPGQKHWKDKAKEAKIKRSRTCLSRLNKRNRLIAKILIGLLIVGIAVGIGVGISKPLGAGIWKPSR